ncbi:MAG: hypothetical protein Q9196_005725 [Gyalolechia fulgens]
MKAAYKIVKFIQQPLLYEDVVSQTQSSRQTAKRQPIVAQSPFSVFKEPKVKPSILSPPRQGKRHHSQEYLKVDAGPSDSALLPTIQPQTEHREGDVAKEPEIKDVQIDDVHQIPWREYEIPAELGFLQPDMPEEIRNIIQESLDEQRAMQISKLLMFDGISRATGTTDHVQWAEEEPVVAESSAMAWNRRPQSSSCKHRTVFVDPSSRTTNSFRSCDVGQNLLEPQEVEEKHASRASVESQSSELKVASRRLQRGRERLSKTHGLFRKLRRPQEVSPVDGSEQEIEAHECTSCFDDIPSNEAVMVPCRHRYCVPCFSQLIATALHNEDHFPPKCCLQEIPRMVLREYLDAQELAAFDIKALEYSVAIGQNAPNGLTQREHAHGTGHWNALTADIVYVCFAEAPYMPPIKTVHKTLVWMQLYSKPKELAGNATPAALDGEPAPVRRKIKPAEHGKFARTLPR